MSVTAFTDHISVEEYIAREARSAEKHDYVDGAVYAMAGAPKIPGGWMNGKSGSCISRFQVCWHTCDSNRRVP